jgi:hypothetical protein
MAFDGTEWNSSRLPTQAVLVDAKNCVLGDSASFNDGSIWISILRTGIATILKIKYTNGDSEDHVLVKPTRMFQGDEINLTYH